MFSRLLSCVILVVFLSAPATARTLQSWSYKGWQLGAYGENRSGRFTHCAMSAQYKSGIVLMFSVNREFNWSMGFANDRWRLSSGQSYRVRWQVDQLPVATAAAKALSVQQVEVQLPNQAGVFDSFRRGRQLSVEGEGQTFHFDLTNTFGALNELLKCANTYKSPPAVSSTNSNPFSSAQQPKNAGLQNEAKVVTAAVLARSGVQNYTFVEQSPEGAPRYDALWVAGDVIVGLRIFEHIEPEAMQDLIIATEAKYCTASFASKKLRSETERAFRLATACVTSDATYDAYEYTIVKRVRGGSYVFSVTGLAATPATAGVVEETGSRVYNAVVSTNSAQ